MRPGNAALAHPCGEAATKPGAFESRSPLKFFALVFALSVPFWLIGAATDLQLLGRPGLLLDTPASPYPEVMFESRRP